VFIVLVVLTLGATILYGTSFLTSQTEENVVEVEDPTVEEAPEIVGEEGTDESTEEDEDEATPTPPDDPTMFLSVPKLGIVDAVVLDGEAGLELGVQHLEGAGYPWLPGSNTYMSGHRVGFPGTGSDHIFYSLPSMSSGDEIIISLQVCTETPDDWWTIGPRLMSSGPESGRFIVRAEKV
jgi:sortase A